MRSANSSTESTASVVRDLFTFLATVPYNGATPSEASAWVGENLNRNASKVFGGVKFEISANSPWARVLRIVPE